MARVDDLAVAELFLRGDVCCEDVVGGILIRLFIQN